MLYLFLVCYDLNGFLDLIEDLLIEPQYNDINNIPSPRLLKCCKRVPFIKYSIRNY